MEKHSISPTYVQEIASLPYQVPIHQRARNELDPTASAGYKSDVGLVY